MKKEKIDLIYDKIAKCIISKYLYEIRDDINDIFHCYLKDILQYLIITYGNDITDERIYTAVDDYFKGMYTNKTDENDNNQVLVTIDIPDLMMIDDSYNIKLETKTDSNTDSQGLKIIDKFDNERKIISFSEWGN